MSVLNLTYSVIQLVGSLNLIQTFISKICNDKLCSLKRICGRRIGTIIIIIINLLNDRLNGYGRKRSMLGQRTRCLVQSGRCLSQAGCFGLSIHGLLSLKNVTNNVYIDRFLQKQRPLLTTSVAFDPTHRVCPWRSGCKYF